MHAFDGSRWGPHPLVLAVLQVSGSSLEDPCRHVQLALPITASREAISVTYRFRTLRFGDGSRSPESIKDGVVQLDYLSHGYGLHERYCHEVAEDGYEPVYREQISLLSTQTGESTSWNRLLGSSLSEVYLSYWGRVPDVFSLARGGVADLGLQAVETSHESAEDGRLVCQVNARVDRLMLLERRTFQGSRLVRYTIGPEQGRLRRLVEFGDPDACGFSASLVIADLSEDGALLGVAAYERLQGSLRDPGIEPLVPSMAQVLDLRGQAGSSAVSTDRPLPLEGVSAWLLQPVNPAVPIDVSRATRKGPTRWAGTISGLAIGVLALLRWRKRRQRPLSGRTPAVFLTLLAGLGQQEARMQSKEAAVLADVESALGLHRSGSACAHEYVLDARFPGDREPVRVLLTADRLGMRPLAGPHPFGRIAGRCEHCLTAPEARAEAFPTVPTTRYLGLDPPEALFSGEASAGLEARVRVFHPRNDDPVELVPLGFGCGVGYEIEGRPTMGGVEILLQLDPHHPFAQLGGVLRVQEQDGRWAPLPFSAPGAPYFPEPETIDFDGAGPDAPVVVEFVVPPGCEPVAGLSCGLVPSCVLVEEARGPDHPRLKVRETDLGLRRHTCSPIKVQISIPGDSRPFERWLEIRHRNPELGELLPLVVSGRFLPDETVWVVWSEAARIPVIVCPQRSAAGIQGLELGSLAPLAEFRAPRADGDFILSRSSPGIPLELHGRVDARLSHFSPMWVNAR